MKRFKAPWGKSLWLVSMLATGICVAVPVFSLRESGWYSAVPLALITGAVLFVVRGYSIASDSILVERLFRSTRLDLAGLQSVRFDPKAVRWSIRTWGNGGLFSFTGWYWNKSLGAYRAFVTDPKRIVVLTFSRGTVVLSPDSPEDFVQELSASGSR